MGGALAGKQPDDPNEINKCINDSIVGHGKREEYKERIERQNFKI